MRGPDFRAYMRQVEEAARAGERFPDPPVQGESVEGLHRGTQVPVIPVSAEEILQLQKSLEDLRKDSGLERPVLFAELIVLNEVR